MKDSVTVLPDEIAYLRESPEALYLVRLFMKNRPFFEAWERVYLLLTNTSAEEISQEEAFLMTHAGALGIIRDMMKSTNETEKFRVINSYSDLIRNRQEELWTD